MIRFTSVAAGCVILFGLSHAVAQTSSPSDLQLEIDALNLMNTAAGPMVADAVTRADQMRRFITDQDLDDAWTTYSESGEAPGFNGLTFDQAFATAIDKQKQQGESTAFTEDVGDLQADVDGTRVLVRSQWKKVNELHTQNAALTGFLKKQDKLDAYHQWAQIQAAKRLEQADADAKRRPKEDQERPDQHAAATEAADEHAAQFRHSLDQLQQENSSSNNDNDDSNDDDVDVYTNVSYYNGYADPYYDVWGHPVARHDYREDRRENHALHKDYNRSNPRPNVAPSRYHRSHGRR